MWRRYGIWARRRRVLSSRSSRWPPSSPFPSPGVSSTAGARCPCWSGPRCWPVRAPCPWGWRGTLPAVVLSAALLGAGTAIMQPALATMIVWTSDSTTRTRAFATQFFLQNLGLGIGGLIGGHIVDASRPGSFTLLFGIEAAMFLVLAAIALTVRLPRSLSLHEAAARERRGQGPRRDACAARPQGHGPAVRARASSSSSPATGSSSRGSRPTAPRPPGSSRRRSAPRWPRTPR